MEGGRVFSRPGLAVVLTLEWFDPLELYGVAFSPGARIEAREQAGAFGIHEAFDFFGLALPISLPRAAGHDR